MSSTDESRKVSEIQKMSVLFETTKASAIAKVAYCLGKKK